MAKARLADWGGRKREDLLSATERELAKVAAATRRPNRPLRGEAAIGQRVGRFKMAKHFETTITETKFEHARDEARIAAEARLDGIHVIRTSVPADTLGADDAVRAYKRLARVERAFRCLKTVDLRVRPIHHRLGGRVRAHLFLRVLAYHVEWHMRRAWAPLLFAEDDPAQADAKRGSPVRPAKPSDSARARAASRRTVHGHPAHHFAGLLAHLATLTRNTVKLRGSGHAFEQLTVPTPLQRTALKLLEDAPPA